MILGIVDANRLSVADAVMPTPNMRSTMLGWMRPIALGIITRTTVDFQTVETVRDVETHGLTQPLTAQKLALKPEGERTWDWRLLHTTTDLELNTGDNVVTTRRGVTTRFRVMARGEYSEDGFYSYEIVNDYHATR